MAGILDWKLQFGAFSIAMAVIALLVWYIKYNTSFTKDLFKANQKLQENTNVVLVSTAEAITKNAGCTKALSEHLERMDKTSNRLLREMLSRPCLLKESENEERTENEV